MFRPAIYLLRHIGKGAGVGNLIKAEFFILRKSAGFKILMFSSLVSGGLAITINFLRIGLTSSKSIGFDEIIACQEMTFYNMIFGCAFVSVFICSGFKNRSYGLSLLSGSSRLKIFFAKFIVSSIGMFLISVMFITIPVITATINGTITKTDRDGAGYILLDLVYAIIGFMAQATVIIFLAFVLKNGIATSVTGIGLTYILLIIKANMRFYEEPAIEHYIKYIYLYQAELFRLKEVGFSDFVYLTVTIFTLIIAMTFSAIVFERRDLK